MERKHVRFKFYEGNKVKRIKYKNRTNWFKNGTKQVSIVRFYEYKCRRRNFYFRSKFLCVIFYTRFNFFFSVYVKFLDTSSVESLPIRICIRLLFIYYNKQIKYRSDFFNRSLTYELTFWFSNQYRGHRKWIIGKLCVNKYEHIYGDLIVKTGYMILPQETDLNIIPSDFRSSRLKFS